MDELKEDLVLKKDFNPNQTAEAARTIIETKLGKVEFSIVLGDITKVDIDAIVCPGNPGFEFAGMGGLQLAISKESGMETFQEAEDKAKEYIEKTGGIVYSGGLKGLPLGFAIATTPGRLKNIKSIIHVNALREEEDNVLCDEKTVRASVLGALKEADRVDLKSVAFPAIGGGLWGLKVEDSLEQTIQGIRDYLDAKPDSKIKKVSFVVFRPATQENAQSFQKILFDKTLPNLRGKEAQA